MLIYIDDDAAENILKTCKILEESIKPLVYGGHEQKH